MAEAIEAIEPEPVPVRRHRHDWGYILIELGIVTAGLFVALMLNGVVEWAHHKQMVRDAHQNIQRELRENRRTIREDLDNFQSSLSVVQANIATLQAMRTGHFTHGSLTNAIAYAALSDAAWHTARDTGALSYMPYDEAQHYSSLYDTIDLVNGRARALLDTQFNAAAPAEMGYDMDDLPPEEVRAMLRGNAEAKIGLITAMQMLNQLDRELAKESRAGSR